MIIPQNDYPKNWDQIAKQAKNTAGWVCEHCGHGHDPSTGHTMTVHHLDGDKANCTYENLLVCCQRCHLSLQASYYPGQAVLFPLPWMVKRGLA